MRVLFHGCECPPQGGGVGAYMLAMARALAGAGHEAWLLTGRVAGLPEREIHAGVTILRGYAREELRSPRVAEWVLAVAREQRVDWIEGADHLGECASLLARRDRPPMIIKAHTSLPLRISRRAQAGSAWQRFALEVACLRAWRQVRAEAACLRRPDLLVAPCARMAEVLRSEGFGGRLAGSTVPNPVMPVAAARPEDEAAVPTMLFAGRIEIQKGIAYLPDMLARVRQQIGGARLLVAGSDTYARGVGSMRAWLQAALGAQAAAVEFLGQLGAPALDAAYRRAWVVVAPSRWDNFPSVVLEACARGRPVVGSRAGGIPEILDGCGCPAVAPGTPEFAGAVIRLLRDPALRQACGEAARAQVLSAYAPAKVVQGYLDTVRNGLRAADTPGGGSVRT